MNQLGFDETFALEGEGLFVSAGRRQQTLGLGVVDIAVPDADDLGALGERLAHFAVPVADDGRMLTLEDPWGNVVRAKTAE